MFRIIKKQEGSILAIAAAAILTIMAITGAAVDVSRYLTVKSKFRHSVDSALISAAAVSRSQDVNEVARRYFQANFPAEYMDSFVLSAISVTAHPETLEWEAEATGVMMTTFADFVGMDRVTLHHRARVQWDTSRRVEAVFAVDTSASMCMNVEHGNARANGDFILKFTPDNSCRKLNAMKDALKYVIDNGFAAAQGVGGPTFSVGIVPFNHKVKLPNRSVIPPSLAAIENSNAKGDRNYYTRFNDAEPLTQVTPLKDITSDADKQALKAAVDALDQRPEGEGWTRSNIAAQTAALMLDPDYHATFGGARPFAFGDSDKVVVMMTDGTNMGCCFAVHPEGNYDNQYLYLYEIDNAHLTGLAKAPAMQRWAAQYGLPNKGICDQMKDAGITIYSVVYDVDDRDPGGREVKEAFKYCASNPEFFFDVLSDTDLKLAYQTISQSFLKLRLTY